MKQEKTTTKWSGLTEDQRRIEILTHISELNDELTQIGERRRQIFAELDTLVKIPAIKTVGDTGAQVTAKKKTVSEETKRKISEAQKARHAKVKLGAPVKESLQQIAADKEQSQPAGQVRDNSVTRDDHPAPVTKGTPT